VTKPKSGFFWRRSLPRRSPSVHNPFPTLMQRRATVHRFRRGHTVLRMPPSRSTTTQLVATYVASHRRTRALYRSVPSARRVVRSHCQPSLRSLSTRSTHRLGPHPTPRRHLLRCTHTPTILRPTSPRSCNRSSTETHSHTAAASASLPRSAGSRARSTDIRIRTCPPTSSQLRATS